MPSQAADQTGAAGFLLGYSIVKQEVTVSNRITTAVFSSLILVVTTGPSFAAITSDAIFIPSVPEPATMTLFGLGIGGAFLARKLLGRR